MSIHLARHRRFTGPATTVGAVALVLVLAVGTLAAFERYNDRNHAREAAHTAQVVDALTGMTFLVGAAQKGMFMSDATLAEEVAAATAGVQAVEASRQRWLDLRTTPGFDPATVARVDAYYAQGQTADIGSALDDTASLGPAIQLFATQMESLRLDLAALTRHEAAIQHADLTSSARHMGSALVVAVSLFLTTVVAIGVATWRAFLGEHRRNRREVRTLRRTDLEARIKRALAMVEREGDAVEVMLRAGRERTGGDVTAMLADSSRAHFHRSGDVKATCSVDSPVNCPAARQGHSLTFTSSDTLDACPHLGTAEGTPCGAVCVPMAVEGLTIGVLHHSRGVGEVEGALPTDLELVASETAQRIGMLRALRTSRTQATTDALTGLPNRRHLEEHVRIMRVAGVQPTVVYADLDHFKQLNDRLGHEAGDRALALFARVCTESLRAEDVVARFGGEEFVIVLPDGEVEGAMTVLERIRTALAQATVRAGLPAFTASFGLALPQPGEALDAVLRRADTALLQAKDQGRNRIVIADDHIVPSAGPATPEVGTAAEGPRIDLRLVARPASPTDPTAAELAEASLRG